MKKQAGFTLIELIMVIVILGILSAFALPRFADLSGNAEVAANQGVIGAVRSANGIARAACLANSCSATGLDTVDLESTAYVTVGGYLSAGETAAGAAENGIELAAQIDGFTAVVTNRTGVFGAAGSTAGTAVWTLNAGCSLTYTEAFDAGTYTAAAITTSGC
jgi:MSHA pilin protein MshA